MAKKKKQDSLAILETNFGRTLTEYAKQATEHGPELVQTALAKFKDDEKNRILNKVNELIKHIRNLYAARDKTDTEIKLFEGRLEQINKGDFKIDSAGSIHFQDGFYI